MRYTKIMTLATTTVTSADRLYESAMRQVEAGELRDASGTFWDAVVAAFEALAKRRGWAVSKHMMYEDVYDKVRPELPGDALYRGMNSARVLERNWVENYELSESGVRHRAARVRVMIDALQSV